MSNTWTHDNTVTLLSWVTIGSYTIEALDTSIDWCRSIIRNGTILGITCSTASGSISVINYGSNATLVLNILFTVLSFLVAINSSRIKIFQIQERMEQCMKLRYDWSAFVTALSTELQMPVDMRQDAEKLLEANRAQYMNLLQVQCELPYFAKHKIKIQMKNRKLKNEHHMALIRNNGLSLSDITFDIAAVEGESIRVVPEIVVESVPVVPVKKEGVFQCFKNFFKM
jgi:hypothetical protein